jgi:hypothetical protein
VHGGAPAVHGAKAQPELFLGSSLPGESLDACHQGLAGPQNYPLFFRPENDGDQDQGPIVFRWVLAPDSHGKSPHCSPPVLRLAAAIATPLARSRSFGLWPAHKPPSRQCQHQHQACICNNNQQRAGCGLHEDVRLFFTRGAVKKKMTKATYMCRSAKKKVVTYFILFLFSFLFFIEFF